MLAQRGGAPGGEASQPAEKPRKTKQSGASPGAKSAKLSFKDQHALKTLPARMDELHAEIDRLRAVIADPGLYGRDPAGFDKAVAALRKAEETLATAEEEWLTLEFKREAAEGA
jgi:ATP-binding cassette subfamily F protein uup